MAIIYEYSRTLNKINMENNNHLKPSGMGMYHLF
jgi:hypothetical protein